MTDTLDNIVKMAMAIVSGCEQNPLNDALETVLEIDINNFDEENPFGYTPE